MSLKDDVDKLKDEATYKKGWHDGAYFVGKKMLLVCSAVISIATASIYKTGTYIWEHFDQVRAVWEAWDNHNGK